MKIYSRLKNIFISRDFTLLWAGQSISVFGNFFMFLALPVMTYNITGSMTALGISISLQALPAIVVGPFAGALADRWDRRKTMIFADIIRALLLTPIILVQGYDRLYAIYSVSFLLSLVGIFFEPAFGAALPRITGKDNVLKANSMIQTTVSIVKVMSPLVGTVVLTLSGPSVLIAADMLSFVVSALTIIFIKTQVSVESTGSISLSSIIKDIEDGVQYILERTTITVVLLAFLFIAFFEGIVEVLMLPYIKDVLEAGTQGFGLAMAVQGAGQILGGIIIGIKGKWISPEKLFVISFSSVAILGIPFVNLKSFAAIIPIICLIGVAVVGLFISINTIIQSTVEDRFMGRVQNSLNILFQIGMLTTTLFSGIMSEIYGIRLILNVGVGIEIAGAIIIIYMFKAKLKPKAVMAGGK